ncbi:MAG: hypothetical protein RLZ44_154 [Pseudomonadota bacterium]
MTEPFKAAVLAQDTELHSAGWQVWVGSEPTFTDRRAETPEWLSEALGGDKEARARDLVARLAAARPGALLLRTLGRQYRGEPHARWSYGLYARRDGAALWSGPPDPLLSGPADAASAPRATALAAALVGVLAGRGWAVTEVAGPHPGRARLLFRLDGATPDADPRTRPALLRGSVHDQPVPEQGAADDLAAVGDYLLILADLAVAGAAAPLPVVELPAFAEVAAFLAFLEALQLAANRAGLTTLVLRGFPPPVDAAVAFTTVTPDPAVIEINMAPAADAATFLDWQRELYAAARATGLSPVRFHYNGAVTDSGGGGQLTLGGPSPAASPFFVAPQLLPRLVRYLVRHPVLSYGFATDYLGGASQAPRADEGAWDRLLELKLALAHLGRVPAPSPELLWDSLSHFLCDASGNLHRSELNIEKLWNPYLPGRGQLGLVEFRAFRMPETPEQATALALLLRAVCTMLARADVTPELTFWGAVLHERFALPYYLQRDLTEVFDDLARHGVGLPDAVQAQLRADAGQLVGELARPGWTVQVHAAREFWPLLGDVASQEAGGSRLVDASSRRLQILLRAAAGEADGLDDWQLAVNGLRLPLRRDRDEQGPVGLLGVRYRSFKPWRGLHPSVPAQDPVTLSLVHAGGQGWSLRIHEWAPQGGGYPGLPEDAAAAQRRRAARFVVAPGAPAVQGDAPAYALTDYTFDLRCLTD